MHLGRVSFGHKQLAVGAEQFREVALEEQAGEQKKLHAVVLLSCWLGLGVASTSMEILQLDLMCNFQKGRKGSVNKGGLDLYGFEAI